METPIEEEEEGEGEEGEKRKWTVLPYVQGTTERISSMSKHKSRWYSNLKEKSHNYYLIPRTRDHPWKTQVFTKIPCFCRKVYIGETGRKISTRIKEHQRYIKYSHFTQSALAEHWKKTRHSVQYDKAILLAPLQGYFPRKYREALEILKHPDNLNRDKGYQMSHIWHTAVNTRSHR